jgi:hypothetical protein
MWHDTQPDKYLLMFNDTKIPKTEDRVSKKTLNPKIIFRERIIVTR